MGVKDKNGKTIGCYTWT